MSKRRKFSDEFKREAVGLTRQPGANVSQVARDIGVGAGLLGRWRRELESGGTKAFTGSGVPRDQEMATLRRELARMKKERIFCAMRQRSSPGSRAEVSDDPTLSPPLKYQRFMTQPVDL